MFSSKDFEKLWFLRPDGSKSGSLLQRIFPTSHTGNEAWANGLCTLGSAACYQRDARTCFR